MKTAFVLSGGTASGSFQAGVLAYLAEHHPEIHPNLIMGVSVGALNGCMLAQNKLGVLKDLWFSIKDEQVYDSLSFWRIAAKFVREYRTKGLSSLRPLRHLVDKHIHLDAVKASGIDFRCGVVTLSNMRYHSIHANDLHLDSELRDAVMASCIQPVIWEPVPSMYVKGEYLGDWAVDGGVRNVSPLGDVLDEEPDLVLIINCFKSEQEDDGKSSQKDAKKEDIENIIDVLKATMSTMIEEIKRGDVREFLKLNQIAREMAKKNIAVPKPNGKFYKPYKELLFEPTMSLGDSMRFTGQGQGRWDHGWQRAKEVMKEKGDTGVV